MNGRYAEIPEPYARWSARVSLFALALAAITYVLHRLSFMATPVALNLFGIGYMLAALGFSLGLYAASSIWVRGRSGAWNCAWGLLIAAGLWLVPLAMLPAYMGLPHINDITTSPANPPLFKALAQRPAGANGSSYPGPATAALQAKAYPDLRTLVIPRSAEEVYELTLDLIRGRRGLGWKVVAEDAPQTRQRRPGLIEATDRTLIMGFTDDIAIRISGGDNDAHLDIRSASRYGSNDFGVNAARIRRFVRELSTRLDAAGPIGVASRRSVRINRAEVSNEPATAKRPLERKPEKAEKKR